MTQKEALLKYLKNHTSISIYVAVEKLGITHLPREIVALERDGWKIRRTPKSGNNRYGNPCRIIAYSLV
jgi:hypothetical protein